MQKLREMLVVNKIMVLVIYINEDNQKSVVNQDIEQLEDTLRYDESDDKYVDLEMPNPVDFPEC